MKTQPSADLELNCSVKLFLKNFKNIYLVRIGQLGRFGRFQCIRKQNIYDIVVQKRKPSRAFS